jgi:Fe2+ transport system protein FeoA
VYIIQHSPVTVVRIEHLEVALGHDLARKIRVDNIRLKTEDV